MSSRRLSSVAIACCCAALCCAWQGTRAEAQAPAPPSPELTVLETSPGTFAVYRRRPGQDAIEGFVVDANALVGTLRERVLVQQGLGNLARVMAVEPAAAGSRSWAGSPERSSDARAPAFEGAYRFEHRFAPPFAALEARLDLAPLDDSDAAGLLYGFAAVLALALVLGLYALYRMTAVQVRFAERRSNFVAAVSHELKTPLTAIRMYGEMLRDDMVEDEHKRRQYYATITSETERLSRLINNVLELSRLERGERPVQLVTADVAPLVHEVIEVFRPHAVRAGFGIELHAAPGLPAVCFERDALTQVLFNLLDNALKYATVGERVIRVHCTPSPEGGVCVSVEDGGPGVDDSQLRAIFEPFYRAQNELTRTQQGTGIGLALVRSLCTRMQAHVEGYNLAPGFEVRVTLRGA